MATKTLITLPPTPKPARNLDELQQALAVWTRQAEQAVRKIAGVADAGGGGKTQVADGSHTGLLSSADWARFSAKQPAGNYLLDAPSDGNTYGRKDGAWEVVSFPSIPDADATHTGLLTSTDWSTFNGKQPAGAYLLDAPSDGTLYGRKDGTWSAVATGLADAPSDGTLYGRKDGAWSAVTGGSGAGILEIQVFN